METVTKQNTIKDKLIAEFDYSKNSFFGDLTLRSRAMESFAKQGIPSRKSEEYKYVNLELILKGEFAFSSQHKISREQLVDTHILKNAIVIAIENGVLNLSNSELTNLPKGLQIIDITVASSNEIFQTHFSKYSDVDADPFVALNTALTNGGVFIHIAKGAIIEIPIHIIHISSVSENTIINPRNLIVVDGNANVTIIESFRNIDSKAKTFNNALTEIVIGENSIVDHYKIQDEKEFGFLLNTTHVNQNTKSVFTTETFTLSGSFVRNNLAIVLAGEHIESNLNGLYLTNENQVVDNHTLVDHRKPNCNSNELYKGIIEDKSSATFNGKIYVRKDAQKTNAFQSNKNILLSDDGTINTKPQLEIYADDVKCSHGTSTGKLDEEKVFYLRARGISEMSAKKMLMHAFASEVVDTIKIAELRDFVEEKISKRFE